MTWLLLGLASAFFDATKNLYSKQAMATVPPPVVTLVTRLVLVAVLLPTLLWVEVPVLGWGTLTILACSALLALQNSVQFYRAINEGELGLTAPLISFTPIFLLLLPLLLGEWIPFLHSERPRPVGAAGVLLIVAGAWVLNLRQGLHKPLAPLWALVGSSGARRMLFVSFVAGLTALLDKAGVQRAPTVVWAVGINVIIASLMGVYVMRQQRAGWQAFVRRPRKLLLAGILEALAVISQYTAMLTAPTSYVIGLKRTSGVFSILYGYWFFGERQLGYRLAGAGLMVLGVVLISMA